MYISLVTLTTPTARVVSSNLVSQHLRLDSDTDDELARFYADAATNWVESYLDRSLLTKTYKLSVSNGPVHHYAVAGPPLTTHDGAVLTARSGEQLDRHAVQVLDQTSALQSSIGWGSFGSGGPPFIEIPRSPLVSITSVALAGLTYKVLDPTAYTVDARMAPAQLLLNQPVYGPTVEVIYTAGYGDTAASIPTKIKQAVLMLTTYLYENRGDTDADMPRVVKTLLGADRLVTFA